MKNFINTLTKRWWGWFILLCLWPFILIYYVYKGITSENKTHKIAGFIGAFIIICVVIYQATIGREIEEQKAIQAATQREQKLQQDEENKKQEKLKKEEDEKKKQEEKLNKESEFPGIKVKQVQQLKDIFKNESDKKLADAGKDYKDFKMTKTDNNYVIYGTKVTEQRGISINNLFTVGIYWDGESENYEVHTNSYAPTLVTSSKQKTSLTVFAQDAVKGQLIAPKTAKFPILSETIIKPSFENVSDSNSVLYQVIGKVEYKNAFNVPFESNYLVELEVNWSSEQCIVKNVILD